MEELFPMFLKLHGRPCLVVGAGRVAEPKIKSLLRCGAHVRVVAPAATASIRKAARAGALTWKRRAFANSDLAGVFLVVAATSSPKLHERIFRHARQAGILCNAVDEPTRCDFFYPAVVRRGALQIAISTAGNAPSLAQRLRRELEQQFGPGYGPWVEQIGQVRSKLVAGGGAPKKRLPALLELSSERAFRRFERRAHTKRARGGRS
jgi:precorrin-2 dehydrogenase/sirohydrochlorin ferrochelatase